MYIYVFYFIISKLNRILEFKKNNQINEITFCLFLNIKISKIFNYFRIFLTLFFT